MEPDIASMPIEQRLALTVRKCAPKLLPGARDQLLACMTPETLGLVALTLVAWVVSHAFGVGEIIDIILFFGGFACLGLAVFSGLDELYGFASGVYYARTGRDLDIAAEHLSKAIAILGMAAVLAVLIRRAPTKAGPRPIPGPGPSNGRIFYRPTTTPTSSIGPEGGFTSVWGDIEVSSLGTPAQQALALLHEQVHRFLTPKLYLLRNFRVTNRMRSYEYSSLWRYVEEGLAELIAQVGVNGFRSFFVGVRFPVQEGYVFLMRAGSSPTGPVAGVGGLGVIPEGAGLVGYGIIGGVELRLWYKEGYRPAVLDEASIVPRRSGPLVQRLPPL